MSCYTQCRSTFVFEDIFDLICVCAVVWNPWRERAAGMSDFSAEEFEKMVCVEAGRVAEPYVLPAGQSATFKQTLQVLPAART